MLEHFGKFNWDELETDVIDGVFSPPLTGNQSAPQAMRSRQPPRNSELHNAVISDSRFRFDPTTRTYKSTIGRILREHAFNILITLPDEGITFEFERTARRGLDWFAMHYRSVKPLGFRMVIVNSDFEYKPNSDDDAGIRVVREGIYFVAKFRFTKVNRALVERSGFEFCPKVKWWFTLDSEVAARLEAIVNSTALNPDQSVPSPVALECPEPRAASPATRRRMPAWIRRRRRRAPDRRQISLKLDDTRKPIIRTSK